MTTTATTFARTVRGSGPGLALAHGAGGSVDAHYGPILDGLAAHHTVVGVDYPGSGATPRSATPLTLDQLADELVGAAVEEGLEQFAIVGFSVGGPVAVRAATRHPDRVSALVLSATYARLDSYMRLTMDVSGGVMAGGDPLLLGRLLTLMSMSPQALASMPEQVLQANAAGTAEALSPGAAEQFDLFARADVYAELADVQARTLVIATTEDRIMPPHLQRELAAQIPGARVAELPTGHLLQIEQPEQWLALITSFIDEA
jgi:pimeloyl-ACP methyl ester carboxylesterase